MNRLYSYGALGLVSVGLFVGCVWRAYLVPERSQAPRLAWMAVAGVFALGARAAFGVANRKD